MDGIQPNAPLEPQVELQTQQPVNLNNRKKRLIIIIVIVCILLIGSLTLFVIKELNKKEGQEGEMNQNFENKSNVQNSSNTIITKIASLKDINVEDKYWYQFSPDGTKVAVSFERDNQQKISINGEIQNPTENAYKLSYPVFSQNNDLFYEVFETIGQSERYLKINKNTIKKGNIISWPPFVSQDGKNIAYTIKKNENYFVVINEKEYGPYDFAGSPMLSPNGLRYAFHIRKSSQHYAVIDGKEYGPYGRPIGSSGQSSSDRDDFVFSPDSSKVAYVTNTFNGQIKHQLWVNGEKYSEYSFIERPVFSPDSKKIAYPISEGKGSGMVSSIVLNTEIQVGTTFDEIQGDSLIFSPDSSKTAFVASVKGQKFIVVNGVAQKPYENIGEISFSPDSKNISYSAIKTNLLIQKEPFFTESWLIIGDKEILIDKQEINLGSSTDILLGINSPIIWSSKSDKYAYVLTETKTVVSDDYEINRTSSSCVVVNGEKGKSFDDIGNTGDFSGPYWIKTTLHFSNDDQSIEYGAKDNNEFYWVKEKLN